jgi:hypothetical protein
VQANVMDSKVDNECSVFLSELSGTCTAVSGAGFFDVTKEFSAAVGHTFFSQGSYLYVLYYSSRCLECF